MGYGLVDISTSPYYNMLVEMSTSREELLRLKERFEIFTVLINRISRNIRKIKNQEMAYLGLRSPHVSCLYYLYLSPGFTATELCERCEDDKATISRSLDFLEKNGFILPGPTSVKRYKNPLLLSDKGIEAGKQITVKINGILDQISIGLSEEERVAFYRSLKIISTSLEKIAENKEIL